MAGIVDTSEVLINLGLAETVTENERSVVQSAITRAEGAVKRYIGYDPVQRTRTEYYPQADLGGSYGEGTWIVEGNSAVLRSNSRASTSELFVQHLPIRSISSLAIDFDGRSDTQANAFTDVKTEGTDFWPNYGKVDSSGNQVCLDGIIRSIGRWPTNPNTVKIVYTAGYTEDEFHGQDEILDASPIWDAVLSESIRRAKQAFAQAKQRFGFAPGMLGGERLGDYSYTLHPNSVNTLFGGINDLLPESQQKLSDYTNWPYRMAG